MNIFDFAIQMEKDGEAYYREIAGGARDKGMKKIFSLLADEEVRHAEVLNEMKSSSPGLAETKVLAEVKNIFARMRENKEHADIDNSQAEMYKQAQELEKKSEDFYQEKSSEVDDPAHKEVLLKLA
ncbi:MAG: ferritin family protein, partial [Candidatus Glassbacteria bacterium]|nr:ferritin family protein [Candidatus Glassbacteria bacterium]